MPLAAILRHPFNGGHQTPYFNNSSNSNSTSGPLATPIWPTANVINEIKPLLVPPVAITSHLNKSFMSGQSRANHTITEPSTSLIKIHTAASQEWNVNIETASSTSYFFNKGEKAAAAAKAAEVDKRRHIHHSNEHSQSPLSPVDIDDHLQYYHHRHQQHKPPLVPSINVSSKKNNISTTTSDTKSSTTKQYIRYNKTQTQSPNTDIHNSNADSDDDREANVFGSLLMPINTTPLRQSTLFSRSSSLGFGGRPSYALMNSNATTTSPAAALLTLPSVTARTPNVFPVRRIKIAIESLPETEESVIEALLHQKHRSSQSSMGKIKPLDELDLVRRILRLLS